MSTELSDANVGTGFDGLDTFHRATCVHPLNEMETFAIADPIKGEGPNAGMHRPRRRTCLDFI